jgi:hypothetical protein
MTYSATLPYAAAVQIVMIVNSLRNFSVCVLLTSDQSLCLFSYFNYFFGLCGCAAFPVIIS